MNPRKRGSLHLVGSPQRLHAAVLSTLPPDLATSEEGRVLWRLDQPSAHEWSLYVVSPGRPSMEQLQEDCGWSQEPSWQTADYTTFLERLAPDQQWTFRLTANPVRSVAKDGGGRGTVKPHVTAEQQRTWLIERAPRHGFVIVGEDEALLRVTGRGREQFSRGQGSGRSRATVSRAQFDGVLRVTDVDALRTTLTHGLGRAKAYGCGLMTLAHVS